jgi:parallel beta-helix repeat protein
MRGTGSVRYRPTKMPRLALAMCALAACTPPPQTIVVLEADEGLGGALRVRICDRDGVVRKDEEHEVEGFPQRVPISPLDNLTSRWFVSIAELRSGDQTYRIRLAAGFPLEGRREIVRRFTSACADSTCASPNSCEEGACTSAVDESLALPLSEASRAFAECERAIAMDAGTDAGPDAGDAGDAGCETCGNLYVAVDGIDGAAGCTRAEPCRTVQYALDAYLEERGGGRILLLPGAHAPFVVRAEHSGLPGRRLEISAESGRPIVDAGAGVVLPLHAIEIGAGAHDVAISDLSIVGAPRSGVHIEDANLIDVLDCEISGNGLEADTRDGGAGIWLERAMNVRVAGNTIRANAIEDGDVYGVRIVDGTGLEISDNRIFENRSQGIEITNSARGISIENNVICRNREHALRATMSFEITVDHNTLIEHDIAFSGDATPNGDGFATVDATDVLVTNNIIAWNATGLWNNSTGEEPVEHHNLFFGNVTADRTRVTPDLVNSVSADPELLDRAGCRAALSETSPARGAAEGGGDIGASLR